VSKHERLVPKNGRGILACIIFRRAEPTDFACVPTTEDQKKQNEPPTSHHLPVVDPESESTPSAHSANSIEAPVNLHLTLE